MQVDKLCFCIGRAAQNNMQMICKVTRTLPSTTRPLMEIALREAASDRAFCPFPSIDRSRLLLTRPDSCQETATEAHLSRVCCPCPLPAAPAPLGSAPSVFYLRRNVGVGGVLLSKRMLLRWPLLTFSDNRIWFPKT